MKCFPQSYSISIESICAKMKHNSLFFKNRNLSMNLERTLIMIEAPNNLPQGDM